MAQVSSRVSVTAKKHIYDGVISSQSQNKLNSTAFPCFNDGDFNEIFGCSNKFDDNGVCTSVPIMELHCSDDQSSRGRGLDDYCCVFGGDDVDFDVELDLFDHMPRSNEYTNKPIGSFDSCQSQNDQAPTNGLCSSSIQNKEIPTNEINKELQMETYMSEKAKFSRHYSLDLDVMEQKNEKDIDIIKASWVKEQGHAIFQPIDDSSNATRVTSDGAISVSANSLHEVSPCLERHTMIQPGIQFPTEYNSEKKEKVHGNTSSECIVEEETNEYDSGCSSSDPVADEGKNKHDSRFQKQNSEEYNATSQKESSLSGSNSVTTSHNTCLTNSAVMDDANAGNSFDLEKAQYRHSRMISSDLGDHKRAHIREPRFQQSSRSRGSYSFDASHDRFATHFRVRSSMSCENSPYRGDIGFPPSLDDELDLNSAAAISAATLQRALEQAEMRIRLAKKLRFKDTLKTRTMIEEEQEDIFIHNMMDVKWRSVNHLKKRASLHSGKDVGLETTRVEPVLEDRRSFIDKDESLIGGNSAQLKFIQEGDKRGGEWEAAKQLNQLISGVKNRIASFMSWPSEKKDDLKEEVQEIRRCPHNPEEEKETEKNQSAATCAGETTPVAEDLEQNVNTRCNIGGREIAGDKVDSKTVGPTDTSFLFFSFNCEKSWNHLHAEEEELGIENRQEEVMNEAENEWTNDTGNEENREGLLDDICVMSNEEIVDMKEEVHCMDAHERSESSNEEDDPKGLNEDLGDDKSESSNEEDDNEIVDEDRQDDRNLSTHEDSNSCSVNDECGKGFGADEEYQIGDSVNGERRNIDGVNVERGGDEISLMCEEENRREADEECEEKIKLPCEEDGDKTINDNCGDYTSQYAPEVDAEEMLNEESRDGRSVLNDEEDMEHEDDRNGLSDEEDGERTMDIGCGDDVEKPVGNLYSRVSGIIKSENDDEWYECEAVEATEDHTYLEERDLVEETGKETEISPEGSSDCIENESERMNELEQEEEEEEEDKTEMKGVEEASSIAVDDICGQTENVDSSKAEEVTEPTDGCDPRVEEPAFLDEGSDIVLEISDYSSEPEMDNETSELLDEEDEKKTQTDDLSSDREMDIENPTFVQIETDVVDVVDCTNSTDGAFPCEDFDLHGMKTDLNCVPKEMGSISRDISQDRTDHVNQNEYERAENVDEAATVGYREGENGSVQSLHRRRRWFDNRDQTTVLQSHITNLENKGSHSVGDSLTKDEDIQVNAEANHKRRRWFVERGVEGVPEPPNVFADVSEGTGKHSIDMAPRRKRWFERPLRNNVDENSEVGDVAPILAEKDEVENKAEISKEEKKDMDQAKRMRKEKKKERIAVARAIREARERAFIEVKEKALSNKAGKYPTEKTSSLDPKCNNSSSQSRCSESLNDDGKFDGVDCASGKRHKARSEWQSQTFQRTDKSLEEKNKHDVAQKEQATRNMFTDALDAEFRRWSCGKEGNVRALLSTLHYILGSDSGWQPVSVIDLVEPTAVRKAYKKATLFVHPDKLQQRGATIQQKYICAKVFNLLKDAWSKFNPNEC